MDTKYCGKCERDKHVSEFSLKNKATGALSAYCKECNREYNREHYRQNKKSYADKARAYEQANGGRVFLQYKLNQESYDEMFAKYGGLCWICRDREAKVVDHDHSCCPTDYTCGKCTRGLLCSNCNTGIGLLRDSPEIFKNAIEYVMIERMAQ